MDSELALLFRSDLGRISEGIFVFVGVRFLWGGSVIFLVFVSSGLELLSMAGR